MAAKQEIGQIIDQAHEFITTPTSEKLRLRNFRWFFSLDNNVDTKAFFQIEGANDHLFCVHTENTQITAWVTKPTPESKVLDEHYGIHVLVDQDNDSQLSVKWIKTVSGHEIGWVKVIHEKDAAMLVKTVKGWELAAPPVTEGEDSETAQKLVTYFEKTLDIAKSRVNTGWQQRPTVI